MRRLLALLFVSMVAFTGDAAVKVLVIQHAAAGGGGGNLLSEDFTGTGYVNSWTESGTGTIDEDETAGCGTGTGWATDCLEFGLTASQTGAATSAFASQTGDVWVRFRAKITYSLASVTNGTGILIGAVNDNTAATAAGGTTIYILKFAGPAYEISIRNGDAGSSELDFATAPASGETHCYEFYRNSTSDAWEWWIDGVSQGSAGSGGAFGAATNFWPHGGTVPASGSATIYYDDVQVSNASRQTCS